MKIDLTDTTSSRINHSLVTARRALGTPAIGMVLTLVIVTDEGSAYDALKAAGDASREHPSRILAVIKRPGRSPRARAEARLDAEVRVGADAGTGETVVLRLHGELANHAQSVVLPLLLPDAPVVVWWPENAPDDPAAEQLGALAARRITDSVTAESPVDELAVRAASYTPGDTDLAWTRITPWRSMLAAALDQHPARIVSAVVEGESYNPSAELLALWLTDRLGVRAERVVTEGPGLTAVRLGTEHGEIVLDRGDGLMATLSMPGQPDRQVALKRRDTAELLAEELRRLDPDEVYAAAVRTGVDKLARSGPQAVQEAAHAEQVREDGGPAGGADGDHGPESAEAGGAADGRSAGPAGPETTAAETTATEKSAARRAGGERTDQEGTTRAKAGQGRAARGKAAGGAGRARRATS